ncbi:hypothetical protein [Xanthocytophaga flavus]|uniref:hypothetical protein n=1 Tax=Xanthocytophaga flava TaxID=3048013 RepID=UPI0028D51C10|nr:hypothetical protein [Xanthocytophaga flavus]
MKKAILNFADRLLSKEQMKKIRGGCDQNCGTENYYRCVITYPGGLTYSGPGCGPSAAEAERRAIAAGAETATCA